MNLLHDIYETDIIGSLALAATDEGLVAIVFMDEGAEWTDKVPAVVRDLPQVRDAAPFGPIRIWLDAYFAGRRLTYEDCAGPVNLIGTPFQRSVWDRLKAIPYGRTVSYGAIATELGKPGAMRAVGMANGQNPLPILIPCHRVVGSTGKLTGFGGGLWRKNALLGLEQGGNLFAATNG